MESVDRQVWVCVAVWQADMFAPPQAYLDRQEEAESAVPSFSTDDEDDEDDKDDEGESICDFFSQLPFLMFIFSLNNYFAT